MQIFRNLLRVIFMLSTIVTVTDCCSSRILLLREHTLKIVQQHRFYSHDHAHLLQQPAQIISQHVDIETGMDFKKNYSSSKSKEEEEDDSATASSTDDITAAKKSLPVSSSTSQLLSLSESTLGEDTLDVQTLPLGVAYDVPASEITTTSDAPKVDVVKASDFRTDPAIREKHAGNSKFHVIDFYYTIMRDVLSFECSGQYLTDFCLNGGRCFRYPVGDHSFFSCECADGYVGERCESKSLNELYIPTPALDSAKQPTILMARIVFSFPMLIAISVIYIIIASIIVFKCPQKYRASGMLIAD